MNATELKTDIQKLVKLIDDESFLHAIRILLLKQIPAQETKDFWNELPSSLQNAIIRKWELTVNGKDLIYEYRIFRRSVWHLSH